MIKIDKDHFINVCEKSISMLSAASELNLHFNTFKRYAIKFGCYRTNQSGKGIHKPSTRKIPLDKILNGEYPEYQTNKLRIRLLDTKIKEHECEVCKNNTWQGSLIPLELHHLDGNRTNHNIQNLQIICPNCHSQTETFRGKNIK